MYRRLYSVLEVLSTSISPISVEMGSNLPNWATLPTSSHSSHASIIFAERYTALSHFLSACLFYPQFPPSDLSLTMSNHQSNPSTPSPSFSNLPLNPQNIRAAHKLIQPYIHRTPLLTRQTLNTIASTPRFPGAANPQINLYFKCENYQKIGAFKARGAHHAVIRLIESIGIEEVRRRGIITHSSGRSALLTPKPE